MPHVTLADGRELEIHVHGAPTAPALLFAHGTPGSAMALNAVHKTSTDLGLRLITWSRPGYATSTRHPGRTIAAHAGDIAAILDHLDIPRGLIAGYSGGAPHALAAAAFLPDRIHAALTISSLAPIAHAPDPFHAMHAHNRAELETAIRGEDALRAHLTAHALSTFSGIPLTPNDKAALTPRTTSDLFTHFGHGLANGLDGWIDDDLALTRPWGFDPAQIRTPVHLWHGTDDHVVPATHTQTLAATIPTATTHLQPGHGHLSLLLTALPTMLATLIHVGY